MKPGRLPLDPVISHARPWVFVKHDVQEFSDFGGLGLNQSQLHDSFKRRPDSLDWWNDTMYAHWHAPVPEAEEYVYPYLLICTVRELKRAREGGNTGPRVAERLFPRALGCAAYKALAKLVRDGLLDNDDHADAPSDYWLLASAKFRQASKPPWFDSARGVTILCEALRNWARRPVCRSAQLGTATATRSGRSCMPMRMAPSRGASTEKKRS